MRDKDSILKNTVHYNQSFFNYISANCLKLANIIFSTTVVFSYYLYLRHQQLC